MKIYEIYSSDPRGFKIGGLETYMQNIIKFCPQDVELNLIGISTKDRTKIGKWQNINIYNRTINFLPLFYETGHGNIKKPIPLSLRFIISLILRKKILNIENNILFIHRVEHALPFLFPFKRNKIVLIIHGASKHLEVPSCDSRLRKIKGIFYKIESYVIKKVDKILLVSNEGMEYYSRKFPKFKYKFELIPTWVDTSIFSPQDKSKARKKLNFSLSEKIIIFIGRINSQKDPDLCLEAFRIVKGRFSESRLLIVGEGEMMPKIKDKIKKFNLQECVTLVGVIPHNHLPELVNCADLSILSSRWEGMPRCVLESLACGVPVVSTDVGDVNKVVKDGISGYVVMSRDPKELAEKSIEILTADKIKREDCVAMIKDYSAERVVKRIVKIHREINSAC